MKMKEIQATIHFLNHVEKKKLKNEKDNERKN